VSEFQWDILTQKIAFLVCLVFLNPMVTATLKEDTVNNMVHFLLEKFACKWKVQAGDYISFSIFHLLSVQQANVWSMLMRCTGVLLTGFPAAYWVAAASESRMIAIQGERYVMICRDNAASPPPVHYHLTGFNYLINGDALHSRALVICRCQSSPQSSSWRSEVLKYH